MTRTNTKYDYPALKQQYVTSDISIRALCRANDMETAFSTVAERARKEHWDDDRAAYHDIEKAKILDKVADARATKLAQIEVDALEVIHAAILQLGINLSDREVVGENGPYTIPAVQVTPKDLALLIDKVQLMAGKPTSHSREDHLGLSFNGDVSDIPLDVLRGLAGVARGKGAGSGPMGHSALPGIEGAKPVN